MPDNGLTIDGLNSVSVITANDEIPVWDAEAAPNEPTKKITGSNLASSVKTLGSLLGTSDVVDNLTSGSTAPVSSGAVYSGLHGLIKSDTVTATTNAGGSANLGITVGSKFVLSIYDNTGYKDVLATGGGYWFVNVYDTSGTTMTAKANKELTFTYLYIDR